MKVKLLYDINVDPKHGLTKGRVVDVARTVRPSPKGLLGWAVLGDDGEIIITQDEAEVVNGEGA